MRKRLARKNKVVIFEKFDRTIEKLSKILKSESEIVKNLRGPDQKKSDTKRSKNDNFDLLKENQDHQNPLS